MASFTPFRRLSGVGDAAAIVLPLLLVKVRFMHRKTDGWLLSQNAVRQHLGAYQLLHIFKTGRIQ